MLRDPPCSTSDLSSFVRWSRSSCERCWSPVRSLCQPCQVRSRPLPWRRGLPSRLPPHPGGLPAGVAGNEFADSLAKEAAEGPGHHQGVPDAIRWRVSLPHLTRRATEERSRDTAQWATTHVRLERRYRPPGCSGPVAESATGLSTIQKSKTYLSN